MFLSLFSFFLCLVQDVTVTVFRSPATLTPLALRLQVVSVVAFVTTVAMTGRGLSVTNVDLICTRILKEPETTLRPAYVCPANVYLDFFASFVSIFVYEFLLLVFPVLF